MIDVVSALLSIVIIDLVLSGDNAIVIGMAVRRLPQHEQRRAIMFGAGFAIVVRVALTCVAAVLLTIPGIKAVGGLLLLWIAFKLLREQEEDADRAEKVADTLHRAIVTIVLADLVMSLDNVLGVAAAAHGNLGLLIFGLGASMAVVMAGGSIIAGFINRLWWLPYLGSGVIAWTGGELLVTDPFLSSQVLRLEETAQRLSGLLITLATLAVAYYFQRHRPALRRAALLLASSTDISPAIAVAE